MFRFTAIVSLMLIATWSHAVPKRYKMETTAYGDFDPGSTLWAASLSCDSCGSECAAACGTRHFRSCCFNYLRRKRGPDQTLWPQPSAHNPKLNQHRPVFIVQNIPDPWNSSPLDFKTQDESDNRYQIINDA